MKILLLKELRVFCPPPPCPRHCGLFGKRYTLIIPRSFIRSPEQEIRRGKHTPGLQTAEQLTNYIQSLKKRGGATCPVIPASFT